MRILAGIGHPGHVHFYRHIVSILQNRGHEVRIASRDKDVTLKLLEAYGMPHRMASRPRAGLPGMVVEYVERELNLAGVIRKYKPHVTTEVGGLFMAPVSRLFGLPSVIFTDSEPVKADRYLMYPYAAHICTPSTFLNDLGPKQIRYNGYHELAYLHPNWYEPDPGVLDRLGVGEGERYAIVRFVAWKASHDIGQSGFDSRAKRLLVETLSRHMRVFVTSESRLSGELEEYAIRIPPEEMHDALYYAALFLGDGATMATEAGVLGTPSVRASSLALTMGNFRELMDKYELVYSFEEVQDALAECERIATDAASKGRWRERASRMLGDKIDVAQWAADFIESAAR